MFCKNCGKEIQAGDKFCMTCGWRVSSDSEAQAAEAQPAETQAVEAQAAEAQPAETQPAETQTVEAQPTETQVAEAQPTETQVAEAHPVETQAVEAQAVEVKPAETQSSAAQPVQQSAVSAPQAANPVAPTNQEKPKKKKKGIFVAIGSVAALAAAGIAVAFNWSFINNFMMKTFYPADKYYQCVEQGNVDAAVASAATAYNTFLLEPLSSASGVYQSFVDGSGAGQDVGYTGEITFTLGELAQKMIKEQDPELNGIVDQLWQNGVTISYETYAADNWVQGLVGLGLGETSVFSLDNVINLGDNTIYLGIPELSEKYLGVKLEDVIPDYSYYLDDMEEASAYIEMLEAIAAKLPDEKQTKQLMAKYGKLILGCLDDVEKQNGKSLKAGDISQKCTRLDVIIDGKTFAKMAKAVCKELADDKEFKKIFLGLAEELLEIYEYYDLDDYYYGLEYDAEDLYEAFQSGCKYLSKNADVLEDSDFTMIMSVYVDSKGKICGREFFFGYNGATQQVMIANPQDGNKTGYKVELITETDGEEVAVTFEGSTKESGGKLDGEFFLTVSADDEKRDILEVTVKQLDKTSMEEGYINGSFIVKSPYFQNPLRALIGVYGEDSSELKDLEISLDITSSKDAEECVIKLLEDGEMWGSVAVSGKVERGKKVSAPSDVIQIKDILSAGEGIEEYLDSIDWEEYKKRLEKAGLPEEVISGIDEISDLSLEDLIWMFY